MKRLLQSIINDKDKYSNDYMAIVMMMMKATAIIMVLPSIME